MGHSLDRKGGYVNQVVPCNTTRQPFPRLNNCSVFAGLKHLSHFLNGICLLYFLLCWLKLRGISEGPHLLISSERVGDTEEIHTSCCFPGQARRQVCFTVAHLHISMRVGKKSLGKLLGERLSLAFDVSEHI